MTLMELQKILGERIRIASDNTLSVDERRKETELSQTISSLAKQMINNADVVLRTDKLVAEGKLKELKSVVYSESIKTDDYFAQTLDVLAENIQELLMGK